MQGNSGMLTTFAVGLEPLMIKKIAGEARRVHISSIYNSHFFFFFWALGESGNKLWTQQWHNHLHSHRQPAGTERHCHLTRPKQVSVTDNALFYDRARVSSVWHYTNSAPVVRGNHYRDWSLFIQGYDKLSVNSSCTLLNSIFSFLFFF